MISKTTFINYKNTQRFHQKWTKAYYCYMNHSMDAERAVNSSLGRLTVFLLFSITLIVSCSNETIDERDQRALRNHFSIPPSFNLVRYDGYPEMVGFGQREGLDISAVYELTDEQLAEFVNSISSRGWQKLPIPDQLKDKIYFDWRNSKFSILLPPKLQRRGACI